MQQEIATWLANPTREYEEGVRLLSTHGRNRHLNQSLARKENTDNWKKLEYELQKLSESDAVVRELAGRGVHIPAGSTIIIMPPAGSGPATPPPAAPTAPPAAPTAPPAPAAAPDTPVPVLSDEVRQRVDEIAVEGGKLYTEQCRISNTLDDLSTDEERQAAAEQIDELKGKRDTLAIERKRLEAGGPLVVALPELLVAPTLTLAEAVQKRNNLRSSVSKAKKEVEKATSPEAKQKKQERLDRLTVELEQAELQLKAVQGQPKPTAG